MSFLLFLGCLVGMFVGSLILTVIVLYPIAFGLRIVEKRKNDTSATEPLAES